MEDAGLVGERDIDSLIEQLARIEAERTVLLGRLEAAHSDGGDGGGAPSTPSIATVGDGGAPATPAITPETPPLSPRTRQRSSVRFVAAHYAELESVFEKLRFCSRAFFVQGVVVMVVVKRRPSASALDELSFGALLWYASARVAALLMGESEADTPTTLCEALSAVGECLGIFAWVVVMQVVGTLSEVLCAALETSPRELALAAFAAAREHWQAAAAVAIAAAAILQSLNVPVTVVTAVVRFYQNKVRYWIKAGERFRSAPIATPTPKKGKGTPAAFASSAKKKGD